MANMLVANTMTLGKGLKEHVNYAGEGGGVKNIFVYRVECLSSDTLSNFLCAKLWMNCFEINSAFEW